MKHHKTIDKFHPIADSGYDIGIDAGAVSINCAVLDSSGSLVYEHSYTRHFGRVRENTCAVLRQVYERFPPAQVHSVTFTGSHGKRLAKLFGTNCEIDSIALVMGTLHQVPGTRTIMSIGGQTALFLQLSHANGSWRIDTFTTNSPCASGTGSFIDQQAERLMPRVCEQYSSAPDSQSDRLLREFITLGLSYSSPAQVACRCTVFTKSDMIHLQNKGESLANIIAGLHFGNAANYISTLIGAKEISYPAVFIGGSASNQLQREAFQHYYPKLVVPDHFASLGAIGAALQARAMGWSGSVPLPDSLSPALTPAVPSSAPPLHIHSSRPAVHHTNAHRSSSPAISSFLRLGVDVGSTTTKYVLIDDSGAVIAKRYIQTRGKPIDAVRELLAGLLREHNLAGRISGIATTGSGRYVAADFLNADSVLDEISAHAGAAVHIDPTVESIIEIGGQDSKYIHISRMLPLDFEMNKVCSAGTGSFLEELAAKLDISIIGQFQKMALAARNPVDLADRCTVFMESELLSYLQNGSSREDLVAGLCYAIARNYLNRVSGDRPLGIRIMFLGGTSLNLAVVAAFEQLLGHSLILPPDREVMGAYGAALALPYLNPDSSFHSRSTALSSLVNTPVRVVETACTANPSCHNSCSLNVYNFDGRTSVWGGECGRFDVQRCSATPQPDLLAERQNLFRSFVREWAVCPDENSQPVSSGSQPVVGIPLALHGLEWGILWSRILSEIGFSVVVSPPTTASIAANGIETMSAETCFPVKVFHGHVRYLLDHAEYIFLPAVLSMPVSSSAERGVCCPLVSGSAYVPQSVLNIPLQRIIRPTLRLDESPDDIAEAISRALPKSLKPVRSRLLSAVTTALQVHSKFCNALLERGNELLHSRPADERVWILTGRPYNLYDERCNLHLGRLLSHAGIFALPADFLDVDNESLDDLPHMYWGMGNRIMRAAKRIARSPRFFGVHLSNFACGPDSFIDHFYRHALQHKPPLLLELDEHNAEGGLLTRIEAYRHIVDGLHTVNSHA